MMPLTMAGPSETVTIRKITGKDEVRQHLAELGFVVDSDVTVVTQLGGSLIVQVKDSQVALDRSLANRDEDIEGCKGGRDGHCGPAPRRGPGEAPHHGHGHHQGRGDPCAQGGPSGRPHGAEPAGVRVVRQES